MRSVAVLFRVLREKQGLKGTSASPHCPEVQHAPGYWTHHLTLRRGDE